MPRLPPACERPACRAGGCRSRAPGCRPCSRRGPGERRPSGPPRPGKRSSRGAPVDRRASSKHVYRSVQGFDGRSPALLVPTILPASGNDTDQGSDAAGTSPPDTDSKTSAPAATPSSSVAPTARRADAGRRVAHAARRAQMHAGSCHQPREGTCPPRSCRWYLAWPATPIVGDPSGRVTRPSAAATAAARVPPAPAPQPPASPRASTAFKTHAGSAVARRDPRGHPFHLLRRDLSCRSPKTACAPATRPRRRS
jgi:hypothetical protein